jgi:methionyl-tRNA formyltransferase
MRIVFFGIYRLGARVLEELLSGGSADVRAVVTKPERAGDPQPVADLARREGLSLLRPEDPKETAFERTLLALEPDLIVVAGYHRILPSSILGAARRGAVNLHLSLLPRYRGPCPWKWVIADGETRTGATVCLLTRRVDAGDILTQEEIGVAEGETGGGLFERLCDLGAGLLARTVEGIDSAIALRRAQDENIATYDPAPSDEEAQIDWTWSAERILRRARGFHPRPGVWTSLYGVRFQVDGLSRAGRGAAPPGTILEIAPEGLTVATGTDPVSIRSIVREKGPGLPRLTSGMHFDPAVGAVLLSNSSA